MHFITRLAAVTVKIVPLSLIAAVLKDRLIMFSNA